MGMSYLRSYARFSLLLAAGAILLPVAADAQNQAQTPPQAQNQEPAQAQTQATSTDDDDYKEPPAPAVNKKPLTNDQFEIYKVLLKSYRRNDHATLHLSDRTVLIVHTAVTADDGCMKPEQIEPQPNEIHLFSKSDLKKLDDENLILVDSLEQRRETEANDPWNGIKAGQSIDTAVRNGFAHAEFTLSEIQFDIKHEHAIVSYSFICGRLCGHGGTMQLAKVNGVWTKTGLCHDWVA